MIPRVAKSGRSFKGAGLYYLHDKGAMTEDRVAFIETANLPTNDANIAIAHMIDTATHAEQLKQASGIKGGRPMQTPVYCYSLAWHTSEAPTHAEQIASAKETLKRLGLSDRQALIIGHNDTDHRHVHVMVNRVCPETGRSATMSNDRLILSDWAYEYREKRGELHFCPEREKNRKRRKGGEFVKDGSMSRQEWEAWKKSQTKDIWDSFRADRAKAKKSRRGQYDALWRQKEERIAQRRDEIKAYFKPQWRDLFKKQRGELKNFDAGFFDRLGFAFSRRDRSKIVGFLEAITNDGQLRDEFIRKQEQERKTLGTQHKARIADASREARKAWQLDKDALTASHEAEDQRAHAEAKAKSAEVWADKSELAQSGQDFDGAADRRKDQQKRRTMDDAIRENRSPEEIRQIQKEARKRTRRERKRKRDRGGRELDM